MEGRTMKPELQRIRIAKACGFDESHWLELGGGIVFGTSGSLPDYPNDLNAMHEAEKTLDDDLDLDYSENLEIATGARWGANNSYDMSKYRSATAEQRAEAFLRTLNLWIE
jgi:hypothetical protein